MTDTTLRTRAVAAAQLAKILFWVTSGLVSAAFILALAGEEFGSSRVRPLLLAWHELAGALSLFSLVAMLIVRRIGRRPSEPLPHWHPVVRRTLSVTLCVLLVLQPISGWLLASYQGKLALFPGITEPGIGDRNAVLAEYAAGFHGVSGAAILILAMFALRMQLTAFIAGLMRAAGRGVRRRRLPTRHRV